jgi:hypothetical protein
MATASVPSGLARKRPSEGLSVPSAGLELRPFAALCDRIGREVRYAERLRVSGMCERKQRARQRRQEERCSLLVGRGGWRREWLDGSPVAREFATRTPSSTWDYSPPHPKTWTLRSVMPLRVRVLGVEDDLRTLTPQLMEEIELYGRGQRGGVDVASLK